MKIKTSIGRKIFVVCNTIILILLAVCCIIPFINIIAVSFSDQISVTSGQVTFWPKNFTLVSYKHILDRSAFWQSFTIAVIRTVLGTLVNLIFIILTAYPLSKSNDKLLGRSVYAWYFFVCMLVSGGLIPSYILISSLGMKNTLWALILPVGMPAFHLVLMLNFFRQIPGELEEAALVDGAGHLRILVQVYLPVSIPSIATITLFSMVNHWNSWFDGLLYINKPNLMPLQTYLRNAILTVSASAASQMNPELMKLTSDRALKCAQVIISCIPILCVYPFLQRFFVTGLVVGSVKG